MKPAEEMADNFNRRESDGLPRETVAKEVGIESREERGMLTFMTLLVRGSIVEVCFW